MLIDQGFVILWVKNYFPSDLPRSELPYSLLFILFHISRSMVIILQCSDKEVTANRFSIISIFNQTGGLNYPAGDLYFWRVKGYVRLLGSDYANVLFWLRKPMLFIDIAKESQF
jgi:hypothetical protein